MKPLWKWYYPYMRPNSWILSWLTALLKRSWTQTWIVAGGFHSIAFFWFGGKNQASTFLNSIRACVLVSGCFKTAVQDVEIPHAKTTSVLRVLGVYYKRSRFLKTGLNLYNQLVLTLQQDSFFSLDSSKSEHPLPKCCWKDLSLKFSLWGIHWFWKTLVQGQKNCIGNKSLPFRPLAFLVKKAVLSFHCALEGAKHIRHRWTQWCISILVTEEGDMSLKTALPTFHPQ